jgi:transcription elongation factor GreA
MAKKQLSRTGFEKLEQELEQLITVKRVEVAQKLKEARSFGDLSENAEYDEAKTEQAMVEARITELEFMRDNVEVVDDDAITTNEIGMGSVFEIKEKTSGKVQKWQIVSTNEVNVAEGKISDESPVGNGALRKKVGDEFSVSTPNGEKRYVVISITKQ